MFWNWKVVLKNSRNESARGNEMSIPKRLGITYKEWKKRKSEARRWKEDMIAKIAGVHWNYCLDCRCEPIISSKGADVTPCEELKQIRDIK